MKLHYSVAMFKTMFFHGTLELAYIVVPTANLTINLSLFFCCHV